MGHKGNRGALGGVMSGVLRWGTRITLVCYEWSVDSEHNDYVGVL